MIEYRRMRLDDVEATTAFALEALALAGDLPLRLSQAKVRSMVINFAISNDHFHMGAFKDGVPVAGLAMYVAEMQFFERCEGHVMLCYSKEPGAGMVLIRHMLRFVNQSMRIMRVQWSMNLGAAKFARTIERRCGFVRHDNLILHKGDLPCPPRSV